MVNWRKYVEVNPKIMGGKPVIKGTRIPVNLVLSYLAGGMTVDELLAEYPHLSREAILACLAFAHDAVEAIDSHSRLVGVPKVLTPRNFLERLRRALRRVFGKLGEEGDKRCAIGDKGWRCCWSSSASV